MKKVLISLAVLFLSFSSFAQVQCGVKAFGNVTVVRGNLFASLPEAATGLTYNKIGCGFGVFTDIPLRSVGEEFGFRPELLYYNTGAHKKNDSSVYNTTFHYIAVPLLFDLKLFNESMVLMAGPQVASCISAKEVHKISGDRIVSKRDPNAIDLSFVLGAAFQLDRNLFVEARYNIGLTTPKMETGEKIGHLHIISVGMGYIF